MALILYGLKNCDTCKKALAALEVAGKKVTFVDIRAEADLAAKVPAWLAAAGAEALVNRRSTTWRQLPDSERAGAEGDGVSELLVANPTLIKRPVIERGDEVFVGWGTDLSAVLG
jgi:arsenate reductase (glutaredoxin)